MPNISITEKQGLFFANSLQFLKKKFSYENMCTWEKVKSEKIKLPTKNDTIDFDFMEDFISAIQKIVIADVVEYAKEKIETTREIIEK